MVIQLVSSTVAQEQDPYMWIQEQDYDFPP